MSDEKKQLIGDPDMALVEQGYTQAYADRRDIVMAGSDDVVAVAEDLEAAQWIVSTINYASQASLELKRARASEKRLADTMKVISFLANQVLAACRESDFAQVAEGLTVIREHFAAALSEVES